MANDKIIKTAGVLNICYNIIAKVSEEFKQESSLNHQKAKRLLNSLLDTIQPKIAQIKNDASEDSLEEMQEDSEAHYRCMINFMEIIMDRNPNKIYSMDLLLQNLKDGKTLYTEEEIKINESK